MNNEIMSIKDLKVAIIKELLRIAPAYLVYFLVAAVVLEVIFGEIKYGANLPYLASLLTIGIPFLICYCHLLVQAGKFRIKFADAGGDTKAASNFMKVLIILIPFILLFVTVLFFRLIERIQGLAQHAN